MKKVFIVSFLLLLSSQLFGVINKEFYVNKNGDIYAYKASGHALFAQKGNDIVCAAVSVLIQNTHISLKEIAKEKTVLEKKDGFMKIIVPAIQENQKKNDATVLLKSLALGLFILQKQYGKEYITVEIK